MDKDNKTNLKKAIMAFDEALKPATTRILMPKVKEPAQTLVKKPSPEVTKQTKI